MTRDFGTRDNPSKNSGAPSRVLLYCVQYVNYNLLICLTTFFTRFLGIPEKVVPLRLKTIGKMNKILKNRLILFLLLFFGILFSGRLIAQVPVERSTEIVKVGGKEYYMHQVKAGQTLYGIAKVYEVTVEQIETLNPEVKDGLQAGIVIGIPVVRESAENEVVETPSTQPSHSSNLTADGTYIVQHGEDLYDIAKKFGIDVADFKALNPGLTAKPAAGTSIKVPNIVNTDEYIVHKVEYNERTSSLLKRWKVSESEFRKINISVGSHVFANQAVLIPIEPVNLAVSQHFDFDDTNEEEIDGNLEPANPNADFDIVEDEPYVVPECNVLAEKALQTYKVVLMVPLYLGNIGDISVTKEQVAKAQKSRSLRFLQYYEGFMMAVEEMTQRKGLKLDLTVIDVTENTTTAENALSQIEGKDIDMIIGPFFGKSFTVVENYAKSRGIVTINPLSTRESIVEGNPNVVKVKPSLSGQILELTNLVKNNYRDANVFIVSMTNSADTLFLNALERQLNQVVNEEVTVSGAEILNYARSESQRKEMGEKMVSTVTIEGQVYSTGDMQLDDNVVLSNPVRQYDYSEMSKLKSQLSGVRHNLVIANGDDHVFATQMLNSLKKSADKYDITLVSLTDWAKYDKLIVDDLLVLNAIYFSDFFVDYRDGDVKSFVLDFRSKYKAEPQQYAFEGYDLGHYFLTALMRYGADMTDCLPYFDIPLMHTRYHFMDKGLHNGIENQSWSIYQFDNKATELTPIDPFKND